MCGELDIVWSFHSTYKYQITMLHTWYWYKMSIISQLKKTLKRKKKKSMTCTLTMCELHCIKP